MAHSDLPPGMMEGRKAGTYYGTRRVHAIKAARVIKCAYSQTTMSTTARNVFSALSDVVAAARLSSVVASSVGIAKFALELEGPPDWEKIKAHIGGLNAEATIVSASKARMIYDIICS